MKRLLPAATALLVCSLMLSGCAQPEEKIIAAQHKPNWMEAPPEALTAARESKPPEIQTETYLAAAALFESQGNIGKAITQYRKAIARDRQCAHAYNRLGILLGKAGRHRAAEQALRQAVQLRPDSASVRNNLGYEYALQDRWADAEAELRNAIRLAPAYRRAYVNLGMVLCKQGRYDEGLANFEEALPEADAFYNLGLMFRSARRYRDAADAFRHALRLDSRLIAAKVQLERIAGQAKVDPQLEPDANLPTWEALAGKPTPDAQDISGDADAGDSQPHVAELPASARPIPGEDEEVTPNEDYHDSGQSLALGELYEDSVTVADAEPDELAESAVEPTADDTSPAMAEEAFPLTPEPEQVMEPAAEPTSDDAPLAITEETSPPVLDANQETESAVEPTPADTPLAVAEEALPLEPRPNEQAEAAAGPAPDDAWLAMPEETFPLVLRPSEQTEAPGEPAPDDTLLAMAERILPVIPEPEVVVEPVAAPEPGAAADPRPAPGPGEMERAPGLFFEEGDMVLLDHWPDPRVGTMTHQGATNEPAGFQPQPTDRANWAEWWTSALCPVEDIWLAVRTRIAESMENARTHADRVEPAPFPGSDPLPAHLWRDLIEDPCEQWDPYEGWPEPASP